MINLAKLQELKSKNEKFSCLTAYDATFAKLISSVGIEVMLVGDSLGNVIQGHNSMIPVTLDDICYHTKHVARGNQGSFIMTDLPFMTYATIEQSLQSASKVIQAGANMVKIEGGDFLAETIAKLTSFGIPVCGHLGLTPQAINILSNYKVQGRKTDEANKLINDSKALEEAGAKLLVLECVPSKLAKEITQMLTIPVIGIGAGVDTDGQILVCYDILGLDSGYAPKFVKNFLTENTSIKQAIMAYYKEVKNKTFPSKEHSFS